MAFIHESATVKNKTGHGWLPIVLLMLVTGVRAETVVLENGHATGRDPDQDTGQSAGEHRVPELELTGKLITQWSTRKSFPESVTFAYYHVYLSHALGMEIAPDTRRRIEGYIASCQQPDGGFTPEPRYATASSVIFSYYALATLKLLGESGAIDSGDALTFLLARRQPDGGIVATPKQGDTANLATTYYGLEALRLLNALDRIDSRKAAAFVHRYREQGRGFTRVEGGASTPQSTLTGVVALQDLGALDSDVGKEVVTYLKGTRYSGLVQDRKYVLLPSVEAMASMLEALVRLSAIDQVDTDRIRDFIVSLYVTQNGGFGPRPGLGTTPPSTYRAIQSLVWLGELPDPWKRNLPTRGTDGG